MGEGELAKGFTCECGAEHRFSPYVFAHWKDRLTHTCECGRKHLIVEGCVELAPAAGGAET